MLQAKDNNFTRAICFFLPPMDQPAKAQGRVDFEEKN
jgi:hypothetical protein